jgi:glutathione synthase/RimK-type ligase-like ATP-grasp enzyme
LDIQFPALWLTPCLPDGGPGLTIVLIITRSGDNESVDSVAAAIRQKGGRPFRFNTDQYPTEVRFIAEYARRERLELASDEGRVNLRKVGAIWHRRLDIGGGIPATLDPQLRMASIGEAGRTVKGMLESLKIFRLDPEPAIRLAENKQLQLQLAREVGLETPRTLITNDPDAVKVFAKRCKDGLITKMLSSFAVYDHEGEKVVFTNRVSAGDLNHLDELRFCPMTFQENVPKALEIRATVVGNQVFAASLASQSSATARDDWRKDGLALLQQWQHYKLPAVVRRRLLKLMDRFRLNYGAADFILAPDGRLVFLELNPAGEFFWLEKWPGLPISSAIADVLLGRAFRR